MTKLGFDGPINQATIDLNRGLVITCRHVVEGLMPPELAKDGTMVCSKCRDAHAAGDKRTMDDYLIAVHLHHIPAVNGSLMKLKIVNISKPY